MNRKTIHRKLNTIIVSLFFIPLIVPTTFNNIFLLSKNNPTTNAINSHTINIYEEHRFPEGYPEKTFPSQPCVTTAIQNSIKEDLVNPVTLNGGPMDSPWPMYSHDIQHTGLSPYSTADNPLTEKWRFSLSDDNFYAGFILDGNGTIYGASYYIYGIYPNGTEKWRYYIGESESTPAIDENGVLYIGTIWGWTNYLHAIYSNNGTQKWAYSVGSNDIDSSPAIGSDGTIYFGDWAGYIHAVNPDGTRKWRYQTGDVITSSPAIGDDGTVYIGSHDHYLYAFYPNGTVKWQFDTGNWIHASPTIGPDGMIYIGCDSGYLYAVYPNNGTMKWRCMVGGTWASPTRGEDGTLYIGTWDMRLYAVNPNGTIKWTYNAPGRIWFGSSATVSSDGTIFFGTTTMDGGSGALIALNPDGTERFKNTYGYFATSPAIGEDGTVYAASFNYAGKIGHLHAFGPGEPKKIVIQQPIPGKLYLFGLGMGNTLLGNTVIIGSVNVKVHAYSWNEIESVHFYVDGNDQYNVTKPPYEWRMNHRYGNLFSLKHTITVTGFYEGGCSWSESIDVMYFHFFYSFLMTSFQNESI